MDKDIKRFSYSRFKTFHTCPQKHHYAYVEQIETPESKYTIPGKLFHQALELFLKGEEFEKPLKEFETLCKTGKLDYEFDLLTDVFYNYVNYYSNEFRKERTIAVEENIVDDLEDGDYLLVIVDQVYDTKGYTIIRDHKTTLSTFKYDYDSVLNNQQLLMYVPFVESKLGLKVDVIEIDEIRLAKLEAVPLNANGKPTVDKKRLELVTFGAYKNKLDELGLSGKKEYDYILDLLATRGHPLFKRTTVQLLDNKKIQTNLQDLTNTYKTIKTSPGPYRVRGPLCGYCDYSDLCDLDMSQPTQRDREIMIQKIKSK